MNSWRLLLGLSISILFVGLELEVWVLFTALFFIFWKCALELWNLQKPPRWLTNTLTMVFLGILLLRFRTVLSQDSASSFLVLLTSLKLLEERNLRDQKFLFLLGFVLISSLFLFSLEVPALAGGLASFFVLWSAQSTKLKFTSVFLKSLPVALFLFLFFPRVQNPFGFQGLMRSNQGQTGFSEELSPGSISKIQNSQELVFRVQFLADKKYRPQDQYWRGQVLTNSEGLRWTKTSAPVIDRINERLPQADYEVTLEPQGKRWLFVWEPTARLQSAKFPVVVKKGSYFESVAPLYERSTYQGMFTTNTPTAEIEKADLQLPPLPVSVTELVARLTAKATSREEITQALLNHFHSEKFTYSKSPGTNNSLEEFLFKGKKGYCEHYAATLATLLRASNVPARVVTGYQGGEFNGFGGFWKFTQADAHAWVEFLNDRSEWERVDPTAQVAPERLELGGVLFEGLPEDWIGQGKTTEYLKNRNAWWVIARDGALQNLESWNYDLVLFLIDFNLEKQKEIFQEYRFWAVAMGVVLLLPFLLQSFFRRRKLSYAEWLLKELEAKALKQNLTREKSETLRHFILRWAQTQPQIKDSLLSLLEVYETEEYSSVSSPKLTLQQVRLILKTIHHNPH
jgi:transglutaminase-like putative cysteine protease